MAWRWVVVVRSAYLQRLALEVDAVEGHRLRSFVDRSELRTKHKKFSKNKNTAMHERRECKTKGVYGANLSQCSTLKKSQP